MPEPEDNNFETKAREAILQRLAERAPSINTPDGLRDLAEAYAWVLVPAQPH